MPRRQTLVEFHTITVIVGDAGGRDRLLCETDRPNPLPPELDTNRCLTVQFDTPRGTGEDYARANFPHSIVRVR